MMNNMINSKVMRNVFFLVFFAVTCLASCGGGGSVTVLSLTKKPTDFSASLVSSRASGVAPLAVFFDATGTVDPTTSKPFHELQYTWDFGDANGSPVSGKTWTTGSQAATATCTSPPYNGCRNNATGAVAAHVFENTGTFTVTLTVFDGTNTVTKTQNIVVTPYSGTTYCFHNSTSLNSGVCSSEQHTSGDIHTDVATAISAGARKILFKRGDSFATTTTATLSAAGPGIIGSYGSGAIPIITTSSATSFTSIFGFTGTGTDWRLMDLDLEVVGGGSNQYGSTTLANQITYLRITTGNFGQAYSISTFTTSPAIDAIAIQDSTVKPGADTNMGLYCGNCAHVMLLGNSMNVGTTANPGHVIRLQGTNYFVLEHSDQYGSTGTGAINGFTIRGNTQYGMISDNNLISFDETIKPQAPGVNENQHDIVVERNFFTAAQLVLEGNHVTVRNNIFNMSGYVKPNWERAVDISWDATSSPAPTENYIYNNTVYSSGTSSNTGAVVGIEPSMAGNGCTLTTGNNLAYMPNGGTSAVMLYDATNGAGCTITGTGGTNGNSTDLQVRSVAPPWSNASGNYIVPTDFTPACSTAYPCQQGVTVPLWTDFFGKTRTSPYDMGAVNH